MLTNSQAEMLIWFVESGPNPVVWTRALQGDALIGERHRRAVDGTDFRELIAKGLVRSAGGDSYELTNAGRALYLHLALSPASNGAAPGYL